MVLLRLPAGTEERRLPFPGGPVTDLEYSPDGRWLAAAGGTPGRSGEVRLWDTAAWKPKSLTGIHSDALLGISWAPDGSRVAACGYDRLVSVWEVPAGRGRALKDHTDAVYSVAFSPRGELLASAAGDRTVKLWDPAAGRRLYTLSEATAELYAVAFHPGGGEVTAGGVDRRLYTWAVDRSAGRLLRSSFAHEGAVLRVRYGSGGLWTAGEDRRIKLWDPAALLERRVLERQPDWPLGLALSRDGKWVAASRYDGRVLLFPADGEGTGREVLR